MNITKRKQFGEVPKYPKLEPLAKNDGLVRDLNPGPLAP